MTGYIDLGVDQIDVCPALTTAEFGIQRAKTKGLGTETSMQEERNELKAALEDETRRGSETRLALEGWMTKAAALEAERDAAVLEAMMARKREKRKTLSMQKRSRLKTQRAVQAFDAVVITLQPQQQTLEAESKESKRVMKAHATSLSTELTKVQQELETARRSLIDMDVELLKSLEERRRTEEQLEIVESERDACKRERDAALKDKLMIRKLHTVARCKKRRLENDIATAAEVVADGEIQTNRALEAALDQAWNELELKVNLHVAEYRKTILETEPMILFRNIS